MSFPQVFGLNRDSLFLSLFEYVQKIGGLQTCEITPFCRYREVGNRSTGIYVYKEFGVKIHSDKQVHIEEFVLARSCMGDSGIAETGEQRTHRDQLEATAYSLVVAAFLEAIGKQFPEHEPKITILSDSGLWFQVQRYSDLSR